MMISKFLVVVLFLVASGPAFSQIDIDPKEKPVQWQDIRGWSALGSRWALALDESGKPIAIYDLSFPKSMIVQLGFIGGKKISFKDLIRILKHSRRGDEPTPELIDDAILALEKSSDGATEKGALPKNWWKKVPWKNKFISKGEAPAAFTLTDIDFEKATDNQGQFDALIKKAEKIIDPSTSNAFLDKDFLNHFRFSERRDGGYDLTWVPGPNDTGELDPRESNNRPRKVIDLRSPKSQSRETIIREGLHEVISGAPSLINIPVVSAILGTALHQYFYFIDLMINSHRAMASEMLGEVEMGVQGSPFEKLDSGERSSAAASLYYGRAKWYLPWTWAPKNPEKLWNAILEKDVKNSQSSQKWLEENSFQISTMAPFFSQSTNIAGKKFIHLLSLANRNASGPKIAIEYSDLEKIHAERVKMQITDTAVNFAAHFMPFGGGLVTDAYEYLVDKPIRIAKFWEARLTVHLEQDSMHSWASEIDVLNSQRANPFEVNQLETMKMVDLRKKEIGIPQISLVSSR